jgi:hypothetical protein
MNWKIIVGVLIIYGGIKEFFAEENDYKTGVTSGSPIIPKLGCITFIGLGFYLIYKGRQKKTLK